ncbi:hypothetical protein SAMN02745146_2910 [Hymenobacter daecheongensis DSM 21074]|uniref:PAP2 superfamily protein n=1 Tax=Hymenobacter daecheongensis DSM 21074 TaxID=1121955 RepID=A0A1M6ING7_9BACT|nr:hypothetical protein [Hymenobacter daecheongensis]SHJ35947.1 hypothetical protein SAMN02745146_2910 [Hymenobacter daecheongensis DSM 21074]
MNKLISSILSALFHPLLLPSYLFYVVCYQVPQSILTPSLPSRWLVLGVVFVFTFVLPALGTGVLYWFGQLDSLLLRERAQRPLPLLLAALSFGMAATVLTQHALFDALLGQMMVGMALAVLLTFLISLSWKISAHGVGVGGAAGLLLLLYLSGPPGSALLGWLLGTVLLAGAVLSARLALDAHTPAQAWAGLGLGAGVVLGIGLSVKF